MLFVLMRPWQKQKENETRMRMRKCEIRTRIMSLRTRRYPDDSSNFCITSTGILSLVQFERIGIIPCFLCTLPWVQSKDWTLRAIWGLPINPCFVYFVGCNLRIATQSLDPRFAQDYPWIVLICTLHITYIYTLLSSHPCVSFIANNSVLSRNK